MPTLIGRVLDNIAVTDIHTHLFDPAIAPRLLWGVDELLTYHYLIAEVLRSRPDLSGSRFCALAKPLQADLIWDELFVKRLPVSEACRGVLTVFNALGLDVNARNLSGIRAFFAAQDGRAYVDRVFALAGVARVVMTNDPFDAVERGFWEKGFERDPRFLAALRLDGALKNWPDGAATLNALGYAVDTSLSGGTLAEVRRYLEDWCRKLDARYLAISLPPSFCYPDVLSGLTTLMTQAVIPVARQLGLPVALMLGVRKAVNPVLGDAGDAVGQADVETVERLARDFPDIFFLVTTLARENTHGLCVAARKFSNLLPFGCWWFLNNPSLIREITAMRLELLGFSFVPQHSDCRILDQLIYKWNHSRKIIGSVLADKCADLVCAGRIVETAEVARDVTRILDGSLARIDGGQPG